MAAELLTTAPGKEMIKVNTVHTGGIRPGRVFLQPLIFYLVYGWWGLVYYLHGGNTVHDNFTILSVTPAQQFYL